MKRRLIIAASTVALFAAAIALPPQLTLASWVDAEYGQASLASMIVPPPDTITCSVGKNLLGVFQSVTINWKFPPGTTYASANAVVGMGDTIATVAASSPQPAITDPDGTGTYSATFTSSLLQTLLGSLLGKTFYIGAETSANGWTSTWATAKVVVGLAGLGSSCTPTP